VNGREIDRYLVPHRAVKEYRKNSICRPARRRPTEEGQVGPVVVAHREGVVLPCLQPSVAQPVVEFDPATLVGMVRIIEGATGRLDQVVSGVLEAVTVGEDEPGLLAVGAGQPAHEMIERAVLHHDHHDMFDARRRR